MNFIGRCCLAQTLFLLAALFGHGQSATAQDISSEQAVRAAMVFNFLRFIEFPPETIANIRQIRLCIAVGEQRQAEALVALSGRKVWGRELVVDRLAGGRDDNCQALYVDTRRRWNVIAEQHDFRRTLTVSAYPGFAQDGGMIEIVLQEDGTRFDINLAEGRRAGFLFAPQLLRLARHVHE